MYKGTGNKSVFTALAVMLLGLAACGSESEEVMGAQGDRISQAKVHQVKTRGQERGGFSERPQTPRIEPTSKSNPALTEAQRAMLDSRPDYNLYKTLVHHVELYNHWSPLGRVLLNASTLPARDREIIMLRMGWLCQSEYEWAQHARIATAENIGMTAEEIHRIAAAPDAKEWTPFERTLMDMVDELRYEAMISDETWLALRARYSEQEVMDALFTAAQYQLVSVVLNSTGIQLDPVLEFRLPTDLPQPMLASRPDNEKLKQPRIQPMSLDAMSPRQRELVQPHLDEKGGLLNLYATMANHPDLYGPRATFGRYLMRGTSLPASSRELLILRTAWLINSAYEWGHHVPIAREAGVSDAQIDAIVAGPDARLWNEEQRALLQAADQLRREAFIHDETWQTLTQYYDPQALVEIVFTVGGYTMTGLAINSFGIQLEPGYPAFPKQ
ncbi:carboxymuconolactone decarboxylase family protein [Proteobacteria bacterium 005FR1]|nr:carboxymuconolactone decarboxylase family protein [Proteobacteria bacterium 005FR1]